MKKRMMKCGIALAVMSLAAVGCQKETMVKPGYEMQQDGTVRTMYYYINGQVYHTTLYGESQWSGFLNWMLTMAKEGYQVRISASVSFSTTSTSQSKDVVHFSTANPDEATEWTRKKIDEGYTVFVEYDEKTGLWNCTAIKGEKPQEDVEEI